MAIVIPTHIWSFLNILFYVPSWILFLRYWDIIGVIAYIQLLALVETLFFFMIAIGLSFLIPHRYYRDRIVPISATWVFIISGWLAFFNLNQTLLKLNKIMPLILWLVTLIIALMLGTIIVWRSRKIENILSRLIEKLIPLAVFYLVIDFLLILIIIIRNIAGVL